MKKNRIVKVLRFKSVNGFLIKEVLVEELDDGIDYMPLDDEDRNSVCVPVRMRDESVTQSSVVYAEVEEEGQFNLKGFTYEKAVEWARDCPQDLANLIFD